jgi:pilus assembly protein CpaF
VRRHSADAAAAYFDESLLVAVRETVLSEPGPVTPARVAAAIQASGRLLGSAGSLSAVEQISAELNGLGPLQPLLRDEEVTDIFVNGPESVWVDRGAGPERTGISFADPLQIRTLAVRLVSAGGRRLDDGSPCVDVRLDGGFRVHAVLPPISPAGPILSIRIRRHQAFSLDELVSTDFMGPETAALLHSVISRRLSFLISGATGTGKTTLLSTLLGLCGPNERLVLIEDAAELNPDHPHVLTLESRHANADGSGAVDLAELVRQALRMNPSRLVVGECRGPEVRELFSALNTGHQGGGCTVHANGAADIPARLTALGALAGLAVEAVALQAASALDVVIHLERGPSGRRVAEIGVVGQESGSLYVLPALTVPDPSTHRTPSRGRGWPQLERAIGPAEP